MYYHYSALVFAFDISGSKARTCLVGPWLCHTLLAHNLLVIIFIFFIINHFISSGSQTHLLLEVGDPDTCQLGNPTIFILVLDNYLGIRSFMYCWERKRIMILLFFCQTHKLKQTQTPTWTLLTLLVYVATWIWKRKDVYHEKFIAKMLDWHILSSEHSTGFWEMSFWSVFFSVSQSILLQTIALDFWKAIVFNG